MFKTGISRRAGIRGAARRRQSHRRPDADRRPLGDPQRDREPHGVARDAPLALTDAVAHSADLSGVSGTPTFFINGRRHHGAYDIDSLSAAAKAVSIAGVRHFKSGGSR